ncbi:hypothetical protein NPIL_690081 [Nephila pilipes]|uniref:Uncharacterized protein n=1 Tax=Nephila pilipes TaxID=299642 RepID=A0A8X6TW20_NEPPI|nr:hypothetical protein NPIL_690081 [Nephila pilipes]
MVISRLLAMENKFKFDLEFDTEYKDFMNEYEEAGHMFISSQLEAVHRQQDFRDLVPHPAEPLAELTDQGESR